MAVNFENFRWMNESSIRQEGSRITMYAAPKSDFFCNSSDSGAYSTANAPFYYTEISGNFVMKAKVSHDFQYTYDSCTLMVMIDEKNWAKVCFEMTDFNTHAAVSVVTRDGASDDANGCNVEGNTLWLQIVKSGNTFGFHYSLDGIRYDMVRFFTLPAAETLKVGLVAQSPVGEGGDRFFEDFSLEPVTVENVRAGI